MDREEALKIVRENYPHFGTTKPLLDLEKALATLIPELAESDDERIRKRLIEYFEGFMIGNTKVKWEGLTVQDVLAYLEKQKEQKPLPPFDEPTPEEKMNHPLYLEGFDTGREVQRVFDEQKSAEWDKEDKEMFEAVDESLYCYESGKAPEAVAQIEAERCWLSSLPERFNLQPKQEWSEEDEKKLARVIWYVEKGCSMIFQKSDKLVFWLKSLRPSWKPSEEQMEALNEIVNILAASPFLHQNDYLFNILNGLREELKKLL